MNDYQGSGMTSDVTGRQNYYEILNVPTNASRSDIRAAYIKMRNTFGSKSQALYSLFDDSEAQRVLAEIEQAYRVLDDDIQRPFYDRQIGLQPLAAIEVDEELEVRVEPAKQFGVQPTSKWPAARAAETDSTAAISEKDPAADASNLESAKVRVSGSLSEKKLEAIAEVLSQFEDLGDVALLKTIRERLDLSQQELHDRTKICIDYIRAMEEGDYERLPQTVFVKGFLRSYLKCLLVPQSEDIVIAFATRLEDWKQKQNRQ